MYNTVAKRLYIVRFSEFSSCLPKNITSIYSLIEGLSRQGDEEAMN